VNERAIPDQGGENTVRTESVTAPRLQEVAEESADTDSAHIVEDLVDLRSRVLHPWHE